MKHVWRKLRGRLAVERAPLADTEAVLLVDDRQRKMGELDGLLDQRVSADEKPKLAGAKALEQLATLACRGRAGEQADRRP
jgi:hypothetical protein